MIQIEFWQCPSTGLVSIIETLLLPGAGFHYQNAAAPDCLSISIKGLLVLHTLPKSFLVTFVILVCAYECNVVAIIYNACFLNTIFFCLKALS